MRRLYKLSLRTFTTPCIPLPISIRKYCQQFPQAHTIDNNCLFIFLNGPARHLPLWASFVMLEVWLITLYFQQWGISVQFIYRYLCVVR